MNGGNPGVRSAAGWGLFARLLLIQASWNHRTIIGNGFAWAIAPVLRSAAAGDEVRERELLARHSEPFNAHPYLAGLAAGAVARAELDGEDPERIRRFKEVLRSPLGAVGDRLFWSGLLPASALGAGAAALLGAAPLVACAFFILAFNAGHLTVRIWATRTGWAGGLAVAEGFRRADLARWARWAGRVGFVLGGLLIGLGAVGLPSGVVPRPVWALGLIGMVGLGYRWGGAAGRPAASGAVVVSLYLLVSG